MKCHQCGWHKSARVAPKASLSYAVVCPVCGSDHQVSDAARISNDARWVVRHDWIDGTKPCGKRLPWLGDRAFSRIKTVDPMQGWFERYGLLQEIMASYMKPRS